MAESASDKSQSGEEKPNPVPLIAGAIILVIIIFFFMRSRRRTVPVPKTTAALPQRDPCEGIPDWACGTVQLLNPVSQAGVNIFKAQAAADVQEAQIRASQRR